MHTLKYAVFSLLWALVVAAPLQADPSEPGTAQTFSEMVTSGRVNLDFRYRFEFVDQSGFEKDAKANTLRSRLTFHSARYQGLSFLAEFDDVTDIGDDDFNSTANGRTEYPVVADPEGTEVNQAWLRYDRNTLEGTFGRQRIDQANQRFVGGVAWRQNEQTFDALRGRWQGGSGVSLDLAYVYQVNRIFGPDDGPVQPADLDGNNYFALVDWQIAPHHTISGYGYLLDIEDNDDYPPGVSVDNSTDTFGVQYSGEFGALHARVAYATQSDAGDSNLNYDADYYVLEGVVDVLGMKATLGYEVLGADNGVGFKTPYATLHKFQGWADLFLTTPTDGIEDAYVGLNGELGPVKLGGFFHDFQAEDSGDDFGTEFDLIATWPVHKLVSLQAKYANFDSDDKARFPDTEKFWFTVHVKI